MLRTMPKNECAQVSGGVDDNIIIVTGEREPDLALEDWLARLQFVSIDIGSAFDQPLPEAPQDNPGTLDPCLLEELSKTDEEREGDRAAELANEINGSSPTDATTGEKLEQGGIVYTDHTTGEVMKTPISSGLAGSVGVPLPPGVGASDVLAFVHSHPERAPTGNAAEDAKYEMADRYPSPADWDMMDSLVANGADANSLTFYVIDQNGDMRKFDYSDKATYDVPEAVLLGDTGTLPALPDPEDTTTSDCGSA